LAIYPKGIIKARDEQGSLCSQHLCHDSGAEIDEGCPRILGQRYRDRRCPDARKQGKAPPGIGTSGQIPFKV